MSYRAILFCALIAAMAASNGNAGATQKDAEPGKQPAELHFKTIAQLFDEPMSVRDFLNPMTLREFIGLLHDKWVAQGKQVVLYVDWRAFNLDNPDQYPDPEALYNLQIKPLFPAELRNTSVKPAVILREALKQVPTIDATYLIRRGGVEITTYNMASPEYLLGQRVTARFEKRPLDEALDELSQQTGATIVLDGRIGDKTKTPVSATFRSTVSVETAVRLLAEMADLQAELEDSILFVTAKPKAEPGAQKSELHLRNRWLDLALKDLARWSGATIVLDPNVQIRKTQIEALKLRRIEAAAAGVEQRDSSARLSAEGAGNQPVSVEGPQGQIARNEKLVHGALARPAAPEEKRSFKVTASFKPNVSIEGAVRVVANQAGLRVVALDNILYVTSPQNAERLRDEMSARGKPLQPASEKK
jgi:hypothetical protein